MSGLFELKSSRNQFFLVSIVCSFVLMNFGLCYGTYKPSSLQRRTQEIENRHKNPAKICILGAACCFLPLMGTCSTRFTPLFVCPSLLASSTARTFRIRLWLRNAGDALERRAGAPQAVDGKINSTAMITKITKITIITIIVKSTQPP